MDESLSRVKKGKVYLAGAGPGDQGLVTLKCINCLRRSNAVVYDNLVNRELLHYAPVDARLLYVGKEANYHSMQQSEINTLLGELAGQGMIVTRLKGGDPFLFGRGGEEAGFLVEAGVDFEIVPGVSSAYAVPAYAGIPLTHRDVNGSVHIVTGHEEVDGVGPEVDWAGLVKGRGTIVFLMGVGNLAGITGKLKEAGMSGSVPAAMVEWGTTPEQRVVEGTLDTIVDLSRAEKVRPPAVGIIGDVVGLRAQLQWAEKQPLHGWRVAITRTGNDFAQYAEMLSREGADSVQFNLTETISRAPDKSDIKMLNDLEAGRFKWLILTSANAVRVLRDWIWSTGNDARILNCKVAVVGKATAARVEELLCVRPALVAQDSRQEGLIELFLRREPGPVLWARAANARAYLREELTRMGYPVKECVLYDTVPRAEELTRLTERVRSGAVHGAIFTSAANFSVWWESLTPEDTAAVEARVTLVAIGSQTASAIRSASETILLAVAKTPDAESVVEALSEFASGKKSEI